MGSTGPIRVHNGRYYRRVEGPSDWWWEADGFSPSQYLTESDTVFPIEFLCHERQRFVDLVGPPPRPIVTLHYREDDTGCWRVSTDPFSDVGFIAERLLVDRDLFVEVAPVPDAVPGGSE